jgi:hypothetical protein
MMLSNNPNSQCKYRWRLWIADWGEGEEDAREVFSSVWDDDENAAEVAEEYLEARFSDFDYPSELVFIVEAPNGVRKAISVMVEAIPEFIGHVIKTERELKRYAEHFTPTGSEEDQEAGEG